jgi:hypothetical protein
MMEYFVVLIAFEIPCAFGSTSDVLFTSQRYVIISIDKSVYLC